MAPQFGPNDPSACLNGNCCSNDNGQFGPCDSSDNGPLGNSASSKHINVPMLALGLALAAFLLVCLSVCLCTYRRAKIRNQVTRRLMSTEMERGHYAGLGLGLQDRAPVVIVKDEDKETNVDDQPPPAYSPKPSTMPKAPRQHPSNHALEYGSSTPNPILTLSPSPALAAPGSPALSSYTLSPALSQGEEEEARLLGGSRALTPPPPTYMR